MIFARVTGGAAFAARLEKAARRLGEARGRSRRAGDARWRLAELLWPLLDKER